MSRCHGQRRGHSTRTGFAGEAFAAGPRHRALSTHHERIGDAAQQYDDRDQDIHDADPLWATDVS
ncbi:hypothetical protein WQE_05052 [Paraburkholderia hospita]|uniref:Uncharacterized protein n=1 Tax=Paraburkholderia hospita TaxID=169430 RepID=A0ABP2PXK8_9BURK|nr:hypothetical protein WQE_05052 [Paraburkholderia hospita]